MEKKVFYLICDDYQLPDWYPAEIFTVSNNNIPNNWKFKMNKFCDEYSVEMLLDYSELIEIEDHYIGLIERDSKALEIFAHQVLENNHEIE